MGVPYTHEGGCLSTLLMLLVNMIASLSVPLFFMISGALLLEKNESLGVLFKKRIARYIAVIILFHLGQALYASCFCGIPFSFKMLLIRCFVVGSAPTTATWWFLYAYVAMLMLLPFLRVLAQNMKNEHFLYLMALQMLFVALMPIRGFALQKYLFLCSLIPMSTLTGYYLENRFRIEALRMSHVFAALMLSLVYFCVVLLMAEGHRLGHHSATYVQGFSCFTALKLIPCITVFLIVKKIFTVKLLPRWVSCLMTLLGGAAFTIMLTENILRRIAEYLLDYAGEIPLYPKGFCIAFLACCMGFPLGIILKQIPGIRKLI